MKPANPRRVLVVDDEEDIRELLGLELNLAGFDVTEATSGLEAARVFTHSPHDVVVTDLNMPGGNGLDLIDDVKALSPLTPVIVCMGGIDDGTRADAFSRGAEAIIEKPFDLAGFVACVRNSLLNPRERFSGDQKRGIPGDNQNWRVLECQFDSATEAEQGGKFRLGRGGFRIQQAEAREGEMLRFRLQFAPGKSPFDKLLSERGLSGFGRVQWAQHALGFAGISFVQLDEQCLEVLESMQREPQRQKAFIPR